MEFDPSDYTLTDELIKLYPVIKKEYLRWHRFVKKFRYGSFVWKNINLEKNGKWEMLPLMELHKPIWYKQFFFPTTYSLIKKIPIYENLMFSIFHANTETYPHCGWGNHFVRIHLGLVGCNDQTEFTVGGKTFKEEDGKVIMFDDSLLHQAVNQGSNTRVILIFDVLLTDLEKYKKT